MAGRKPAEYWVVDLDARVVERSRPQEEGVELVAEALEWRAEPGLEPPVIELPEYFADVLGESRRLPDLGQCERRTACVAVDGLQRRHGSSAT